MPAFDRADELDIMRADRRNFPYRFCRFACGDMLAEHLPAVFKDSEYCIRCHDLHLLRLVRCCSVEFFDVPVVGSPVALAEIHAVHIPYMPPVGERVRQGGAWFHAM